MGGEHCKECAHRKGVGTGATAAPGLGVCFDGGCFVLVEIIAKLVAAAAALGVNVVKARLACHRAGAEGGTAAVFAHRTGVFDQARGEIGQARLAHVLTVSTGCMGHRHGEGKRQRKQDTHYYVDESLK